MHKLLALVPICHHSQRVPGKNYRLLAVPEIDQIVVDTDSDQAVDSACNSY